MSKTIDIINFLNPLNHINQGKTVKIPGFEIVNTKTGETHTIGGTEYTHTINETSNPAKGATTMDINTGASSEDVANAINEYNRKMEEYNEKEYEYRKWVDELAQSNWQNEFDFEKDKYKQQLKENQLTRDREDTAYQRTMRDMALAGINPLMVGRFGLDPTSLGQVAGNAPASPSFHGGTPSPIQSQAAVLAAENASKRQAETARQEHILKAREIEIEQEQFDRQEKQFYDQLDQAWEIAKKDRSLRRELSDAESETEKWIAEANNNTSKEIAAEQRKLQEEFKKIENELQKRGQNLQLIESIIRLGESMLALKAITGNKNTQEIPGAKPRDNYKPKSPADPGWTPEHGRSNGGIYY